MNLTRINIVLAVLLVLTSLLAVSLKIDYSKPNIEFLPTMVHSPAYHAYAANPNFPNGRTLQAPVPGTIPRGDLPLYYTASKEDAVRAGLELKNPFAIDAPIEIEEETASETGTNTKTDGAKTKKLTEKELAEALKLKKIAAAQARLNASIERGTEIFNTFCITCHGPAGLGDGLVTKRGFPPPPPLPTGKSTEMKDGQLFHILTYGQGSMAPMVSQLSRNSRWDVINYVRTLQKGKKPATPAAQSGKKPEAGGKAEQPKVKPEVKTETKPKTKPEAKPVSKPEPENKTKPKPKAAPETTPEKKSEQKPKVETKKSTTAETKTAKPEATGKAPKAEEKKP